MSLLRDSLWSKCKNDPLKFVFWKKRLKDVREILKAEALEKLKLSCPTLFQLGWFKENTPKTEIAIQQELEDLKKENEILATNAMNSNASKRERQLDNDVFIPIPSITDNNM